MCGIFAAVHRDGAAPAMVYEGLLGLQHRGQESAGIATWDGRAIGVRRGSGLVAAGLPDPAVIGARGTVSIGHVRYSTNAPSDDNAQPLVRGEDATAIALVHNGAITNAADLGDSGGRPTPWPGARSDTQVLADHLWATCDGPGTEAIARALRQVEGAYSLVLMHRGALWLMRDPHGFRPLFFRRVGRGWAVASETCALPLSSGEPAQSVEPGEIVVLEEDRIRRRSFAPARSGFCALELIYLSHRDSVYQGAGVADVRHALGRAAAIEAPAEADIVVGVPSSGVPSAIGYAAESGIPRVDALRLASPGLRSFIQPTEGERRRVASGKFEVAEEGIEDRRVAVVDDSLVRGTTMREVCALLRRAGARSVHVRITSPKVVWPCYFGVDLPDPGELLARGGEPAVAEAVGADSIAFLPLRRAQRTLVHATGLHPCLGCFSGRYPARPGLTAPRLDEANGSDPGWQRARTPTPAQAIPKDPPTAAASASLPYPSLPRTVTP